MDDKLNAAYWKAVLYALLRHFLSGVGAYLIARGYFTEGQVSQLFAGLASFICALVWTVMNKTNVRSIIAAALRSPQGATYEEVKQAAKQ